MMNSIAAVVVAVSLMNNSVIEPAEKSPPPLSENVTIRELFEEMNRRRASAGLPAMELDEELCVVSQRWSNYMSRSHAFHHGGGENIIAMGQTTPREAINSWMNSSGHRAFLMGGSRRVGFGAQRASNGTWYWSGTFR